MNIDTIKAKFTFFSVTPPLPLEGALSLNNKLNNAEKLFLNEIKGPEHMEVHNGVLYTTLEGGYVAKLVGNKIVPVVKFGKKCGKLLIGICEISFIFNKIFIALSLFSVLWHNQGRVEGVWTHPAHPKITNTFFYVKLKRIKLNY